jgi:hypothetical protein
MSRLPDYLQPPAIKVSVQQLVCTGCGAETNAPCNCKKPYVPKAVERVAEYDKAKPGQSTRQAAADLGTTSTTVSKARRANQFAPETVTGRDGKSYPATATVSRRLSEPEPEPEPISEKDGALINKIMAAYERMSEAGQRELALRIARRHGDLYNEVLF